MSRVILIAAAAVFILMGGCASPNADDPLKNTKKLVSKGHASLYENGAFQVGHTSLKLIPAGPQPLELAMELAGVRATESFQKALKEAKESVYIIPQGSRYSLKLAESVWGNSSEFGDSVTEVTREVGAWAIDKSYRHLVDKILNLPQSAIKAGKEVYAYGDEIEEEIYMEADAYLENSKQVSAEIMKDTLELSKSISKSSEEGAGEKLEWALSTFVVGYAALPEKLEARGENISNAADGKKFAEAFDEAWQMREKGSIWFSELFGSSISDYGDNVGESLKKARDAFMDNYEEEGVILSSLKSMRWALHALIYNGVIEPIGKMAAGAVGYISVNGVIFPVVLVSKEGIAVTQAAAEIVYNSALGIYEITAPTIGAAVAGLLGSVEYIGGKVASGATLAGGATLSAAGQVGGYVPAGVAAAGGFISGKSIKYIGVPMAAVGVSLGEASYGVVAGTAGAIAGGTVLVAGEAAGVSAKGIGAAASGAVLVGGTAASVAAGAGIGAYQLSKAVVVPAGYTLSSGVVLGYGAASQLAAHSILAVSDAAYLVLSLEGPRWVIYAVSGNLKESDKISGGAIVDLEAMHQKGEKIQYLPLSEKEISDVVNALSNDLPKE